MADTGLLNPSGTGLGGGSNWTGWTIGNINASDDVRAEITTTSADVTATARNFEVDTAFPGGTIQIDGIEILLEGVSLTPGRSGDIGVDLTWDGGSTYTAVKSKTYNASESAQSYGGAADTWGRTWAASEFTDANFRVRMNIASGEARFGLGVDRVQVKVYYTVLNPSPNVSDQVTVSELISFFNSHRNISLSDSVTVAEQISFFNSHRNISKSESITVAESVTMRVVSYISTSDFIEVYESGINGTQTVLPISQDTFYGTAFLTGPNPTATELHVGGWGDDYYAFLQFNLSGAPSTVGTAKLKVYQTERPGNSPEPEIHQVTQSWDDDTLDSENAPTYDVTAYPFSWANAVGYKAADINQIAYSWLSGAASNFGVMLAPTITNNADTKFASNENATSAFRPTLTITPGVTMVVASNVNKSESVTVAESVTIRVNAFPVVSDAVSVVDAPTIVLPALVPNVNDAVSVSESMTTRANLHPQLDGSTSAGYKRSPKIIG